MQNDKGLQIDQDLVFQRRAWVVERAAWIFIALGLIAGLLGVFGNGPLSSATAGQPGSAFWIDYDRFVRNGTPTTYRVHIGPHVATDGRVAVWLDRGMAELLDIEVVTPNTNDTQLLADRIVYRFAAPEPGRAIALSLRARPAGPASIAGRAGVVGGPELRFRQLVYP